MNNTLKDYLKDEVDDKFYITNEKARNLIDKLIFDGELPIGEDVKESTSQQIIQKQLKQQIASQQRTEVYQHVIQKEPMLLKSQGSELERKTDIACTLMARDYKGFGNQEMNGVIEWKEIN